MKRIDLSNLSPGGTLKVPAGTYAPIIIRTPNVTIDGTGGAIIDASGKKHGIIILADGVTVRGFEVKNALDTGISAQDVHHLTIDGNHSHDNGGYGIFAGKVDFVTITNNLVHDNISLRPVSGISIHPKDHGLGGAGYHAIITGNESYGNKMIGPARHTDGFGFIWDNNPELAFNFSALFQNNHAHHNGKEGFLFLNGDSMFFRDNLSEHNYTDGIRPRSAEVEFRDSSVHSVGNRIFADPGHKSIVVEGEEPGHKLFWKYNHIRGEVLAVGAPHELPAPHDNFFI